MVNYRIVLLAGVVLGGCGGTNQSAHTSVAVTTTTTEFVAPSTPQPPMPKLFSAEELEHALPHPIALPLGWTADGVASAMSGGELEESAAAVPTDWGQCGGPTWDQLAIAAGAISNAFISLGSPSGNWGIIEIYAFQSPSQADEFISASDGATSCVVYEFKEVEVDYDDPSTLNPEPTMGDLPPYDGFGENYFVGEEWTTVASMATGSTDIEGADRALTISWDTEHLMTVTRQEYGHRTLYLRIYEQRGQVVLMWDLYGDCCFYGYSDASFATDYRPTFDQLTEMATLMRDGIIDRLGPLLEPV